MSKSSPYLQRILVLDNGHLLIQVLRRSGILVKRIVHKELWDHIEDEMLLEFTESGHPIFRATTPLSRGILKSTGHGKPSIHFTADYPIETIFRMVVSAYQLSIYGAVANICEEFEAHQDRTGQLVILVGQSIVLGEVKAETPVHDEDPRNDQLI